MDKSYRETLKPSQPDFWKNLWFYNKKIIISVVIAAVIVVLTVARCASIPAPDASVLIITRHSRTPEVAESLKKGFSEVVEDINGDGKVTVDIAEVFVPEEDSAELQTSNEMKAVNELINGDSTVVIAEKELVEGFFGEEDFFEKMPAGKYPQVFGSEGKAVDITACSFAEEMFYHGDDTLCLMIKSVDENSPMYEMYLQGRKIADQITKS